MAKIRKIYSRFGRNGPNKPFLAKNSQNWAKKSKTRILPQKNFAIFYKTKKQVPMAKIRKIYSSVWEKWAEKSIFGQKRPNVGQKLPKNRKREFSLFRHFLKDQKIGSYGKNQENLQQRLGEMGQKQHFWPKTAKFLPKIENENFPAKFFFVIF